MSESTTPNKPDRVTPAILVFGLSIVAPIVIGFIGIVVMLMTANRL